MGSPAGRCVQFSYAAYGYTIFVARKAGRYGGCFRSEWASESRKAGGGNERRHWPVGGRQSFWPKGLYGLSRRRLLIMFCAMTDQSATAAQSTKVFLRRRDGFFYGLNGTWTESLEAAREFENASRALIVGRGCGVSELEIVIRNNEAEDRIAINS